MNARLKELLEEVRAEAEDLEESLQAPAHEREIGKLKNEARLKLGADLPDEYIEFLREANGFSWEDLTIYASESTPHATYPESTIEGFVKMNVHARETKRCGDFLIFGEAAKLDLYTQRISTGEFQILDHGTLSLTKTVPTFDEMMIEALEIVM
jgi:DNA-binding transcriptional regulator YiaG